MYGQTECQRVCYLPPDQLDARMGSVGIAIPRTEVWIEDEDGNPAGADVVGELFVRGGHVMQGYWNDPEATARKLRLEPDGGRVLATGDLFRADADGYLYFVSRPRRHHQVARGEGGAPRGRGGAARRRRREGGRRDRRPGPPPGPGSAGPCRAAAGRELDARMLMAACAQRLEDYMVPRRIVIHDELPKTANGKLDKRALAERASA